MFTKEMGNYATLGPEVASRTFISGFRTCGSIFEHTDPSNLDPITYITDPEHCIRVFSREIFNHWIQIDNIWTIDPDQEHLYHESDQSVVLPIFPIFTTLGSRAFLSSPPLDQNGADDYQLIISWT
jgi:hypothetical protein